jgi:nitrogenase molybdenum-iron protein NifN
LKEIVCDFEMDVMIFPDYSDTLDGTSWDTYQRIPEGGVSIEALKKSALASLSIELGYILNTGGYNGKIKKNVIAQSAGEYLQNTFDVTCRRTGLPVGMLESDKFFRLLSAVSGKPIPEKYNKQRGRLLDLYIDGHKYVSMKRAVIYGEEDLTVALAAFLAEIGVIPVLCASGGESGKLKKTLQNVLGKMYPEEMIVGQGMTFEHMETAIQEYNLKPDLLIGNSKGYYSARKLDIPIVRTGFPIHDRIGAQHKRLLSYEGAAILFEEIVNTLLEDKQRKSSVGYQYM